MKNIKSNMTKLFIGAFVLIGFASCNFDDGYEDYNQMVKPSAQELSGEWYIDIINEATGEIEVHHAFHKTYDSNDGKLWISDHIGPPGRYTSADFTGWWLFGKVNYNAANLTFSGSGVDNIADGSVVNITDGKILKNAAHTLKGTVTDSIYFKGEFDYEPGKILIFSGRKRTGFDTEDDQ